MHFSLHYDMRAPDFGAKPVDLYQAALDQCEWGDRLGFQSCYFLEHHAAEDGYLPSPIVLASAVAGRTRNILIQLQVIVLPLHDPLRLAEDLAVLDLVSNGRLRLTVAAGYRPEEYEMFGRDFKKRPSLMEKNIEVLKQAWTGEPFEYEGRTVRILPRPAQQPRPRISMGGSSEAASRRAARIADDYLPTDAVLHAAYRDELAKLGKPVPPPMPTPKGPRAFYIHITRDPETTWQTIYPHALHETNDYGRWARGLDHLPYREVSSLEELKATGLYRIYTPEEAVAYGRENGGMALKPLLAGLDPASAQESLRLFETEVLPQLRG